MHIAAQFTCLLLVAPCFAKVSPYDLYDVDEETCSAEQMQAFGNFIDDALLLTNYCWGQIDWLQNFGSTGVYRARLREGILGMDTSKPKRKRGRNDVNLMRNAGNAFGLEDLVMRWLENEKARHEDPATAAWEPRYEEASDRTKLRNAQLALQQVALYITEPPDQAGWKPYLGCGMEPFNEEIIDGQAVYVRRREGKDDVKIPVRPEGEYCECSSQRGFSSRSEERFEAMVLCESFFDERWARRLTRTLQTVEGEDDQDDILANQLGPAGWFIHQALHQGEVDCEPS